ncbi:Hpt domain-containing protein [candidate division KSB1 bacterium]
MTKDIYLQYYDEAKEYLNLISSDILFLEKSGFKEEVVNRIYRQTHSLKGISKIIELNEAVQLAHKIEDLLEELKNNTIMIEKDTINLFLEYIDFMSNLIDAKIKSEENNINGTGILEKLKELKEKEEDLKKRFYEDKSDSGDLLLFDILTIPQEKRLVKEQREGFKSYDITVFLKKAGFPENLKRVKIILNDCGNTIALTGSSEPVPKGFGVALVLLYNSKKDSGEISNILAGENFKIREIPESYEKIEDINETLTKEYEGSIKDETGEEIDEEKLKHRKSYIDESLEELVNITQHIISMESESDNKEIIDRIFRTFHSLKGSGGTFGLMQISEVAHELETVMGFIREGEIRVSSSIIDLLLEGIDNLSTIFSNAQENKFVEYKKFPIIDKIQDFLSNTKKDSQHGKNKKKAFLQSKDISDEQKRLIQKTTSKSKSETIRVNLKKLDHLVNVFEELILYKNTEEYNLKVMENLKRKIKRNSRRLQKSKEALLLNSATLDNSYDDSLKSFLNEMDKTFKEIESLIEENYQDFQNNVSRGIFLIDELQMEILKIRMLPVSTILNQYYRLVRDLSQKEKKKISLEITGEEIELDKRILEEINDPLIHIIRNSVNHGIELPDKRLNNGKCETGTISISVTQRGNQVIIEIKDDGAGIDIEKIKSVVLQKKFLEHDTLKSLSDQEVLQFIFMPGFSTAKDITDISGRGVGMDVVKNNLKKINGTVNLDTQPGKSTAFYIKVPLTMAVRKAILIQQSDMIFAITTDSIEEILLINNSEIEVFKDVETVKLRNSTISVIRLGNIMKLPGEENLKDNISVIVTSSVEKRIGILVEKVLYQQEIVVRNFGSMLGKVPKFSGTTILQDGSIALVLDIPYIIDISANSTIKYKVKKTAKGKKQKKNKILVVEDSLITRNLFKSILESFNYDVITAPDGKQALKILEKNIVDLVVTDIMMPGIDGYELTSKIKKMPECINLPVIIVSNKGKEKEKIKGLECGADAYMIKSDFEKHKFLNIIENLL